MVQAFTGVEVVLPSVTGAGQDVSVDVSGAEVGVLMLAGDFGGKKGTVSVSNDAYGLPEQSETLDADRVEIGCFGQAYEIHESGIRCGLD